MVVVAYPVMAWRRPALQPVGIGRQSRSLSARRACAFHVNPTAGGRATRAAATAAGSALNGMASVISAKGDYNLSTSAAAINMTQAQKNEIQNQQQWTNTYFKMRATNKAATAAERGPTPTMEQLATNGPGRRAQAARPQPNGSRQRPDSTGPALCSKPASSPSAARWTSCLPRGPGTAASATRTK